MTPSNENIAVVQRLDEAGGNPEVIRHVVAPDARWGVARGAI
jgi:hypothetical protein